jgi:beta-mannosidase
MEAIRQCLDGKWRAAGLLGIPQDGEIPDIDKLDWFDAQVPGEIHQDLTRAGRLENIFSGKSAAEAGRWVSAAEWIYQREFDLPGEMLAVPNIFLDFDSVDTFADVFVNGTLVGVTKNAFLRQSFPLNGAGLKARGNVLTVRMKGHLRMVEPLAEQALQHCAVDNDDGRDYARSRSVTRRSQRTYSADLVGFGCYVTGIGLPKSVFITAYPEVYVADSLFRVLSADAEAATIQIDATLNKGVENMKVQFSLTDESDKSRVWLWEFPVCGNCASGSVRVERPSLWWPNGYGNQNMHTLQITLLYDGKELFRKFQRVGIRQVELIRALPNGKPTFRFRVNGNPVFIFGGNLMPINYLTATGSRAQSQTIIDMAVNANLNLLRIWGGGNNESEWFYEMCDVSGILLWKDMFLHTHTYPDFNEEFVAEVVQESRESLRYLRNHPCFALVCGGNEQQEFWDAYHWREMFDTFYGARLLYQEFPKVVTEMAPDIAYIPNSPHGKKLAQSPVDGETHTWGNFFNATKDPQFSTETCWFAGSYPRPETIEKVMGVKIKDFEAHGWHKKWRDLTGQEMIGTHQYGEYHRLETIEAYLESLEIEQMLADYHGFAYLRFRSSSCNGIMYWPFNKGGMFILFGCIDYDQRPLMSYYQLCRLFKPVACHLYRDIDDISLVASNASWSSVQARVVLKHMHADGRVLQTWEQPISIRSGNSIRLMNLEEYYLTINDRWREMIHADVYVDNEKICQDSLYFCTWSEFDNREAQLACSVQCVKGGWKLTVTSDTLVKMVSIESKTKLLLDDNYFSMMPGEERTVAIRAMEAVDAPIETTVKALDCKTEFKFLLS